MFRHWGSDSRGGEQSVKLDRPMLHDFSKPVLPITHPIATSGTGACSPPRPCKRERDEDPSENAPPAKRARPADVHGPAADAPSTAPAANGIAPSHLPDDRLDRARDAIEFHFGLEILFKHDELRLIDQELAKCQVALEQLRRCHLIPYPVNCPTPDQMMDICSGKGPALRKAGKEVPRWAPPFGVVDGPYARHYAKWLIPDPMFDGMLPEWQPPYQARSARSSTEGRTTRNSTGDGPLAGKQRPSRGNAGQKLQSLMSGYPPAKDKSGPCVLKRQSDGQTVKLVCIDCHRENFLSIQGFINHCRIAHRRDFKSHEEAAIRSGKPLDANETKTPATPKPASEEPKPQPASAIAPPPPSGLVHPYAQPEVERQQAFVTLQSRIQESLRLYKQGKLPGVTRIPGQAPTDTPSSLVPSSDTPYLSRLMKAKNFDGDLEQLVGDAKTKVDFEDVSSPGEDLEEPSDGTPGATPTGPAPPATRMPVRATMAPAQRTPTTHPTNVKGLSPVLSFEPLPRKPRASQDAPSKDEDESMDPDLSPNPSASNNAPSLVSDDGEYDESDDGSSECGASEAPESGSISDVADITMEDDGDTPRSLRHHGDSGTGTTVRFRKDDEAHIAFVNPVKDPNDQRDPRKI